MSFNLMHNVPTQTLLREKRITNAERQLANSITHRNCKIIPTITKPPNEDTSCVNTYRHCCHKNAHEANQLSLKK